MSSITATVGDDLGAWVLLRGSEDAIDTDARTKSEFI